MPVLYYLETTGDPVEKQGALWNKPLPLASHPAPTTPEIEGPVRLTYGDYFEAAHHFLVRNDLSLLRSALEQRLGSQVEPDRLRHLNIFLVKHGEFYHPARIQLLLDEQPFDFVLNVAASEVGRRCLAEEFNCLTRLDQHPAAKYIPRIYGQGEVAFESGLTLLMWLGEWFEDFHEFHWTRDEIGGDLRLVIWDPLEGKRYLDAKQTGPIFRQAASILTHFFDLTTFEQIHSWHHAAGDFIVRQQKDRFEVRLITVRGYAGMMAGAEPNHTPDVDTGLTLQVMLLFLLKLSLRMRLDRLDGVGDIVWADECVVRETVAGFRSALAEKQLPEQLPASPIDCFDAYMVQCTESDLMEILEAVVATYPENHAEKSILLREMKTHARILFQSILNSV